MHCNATPYTKWPKNLTDAKPHELDVEIIG
jgi:hypothetical protein